MYTIGYDFSDTYIKFGDIQLAVRLSTERNVYAPSKAHMTIDRSTKAVRLHAKALSAAGGQITSTGEIELSIMEYEDKRLGVTARGFHPDEKCKSIQVFIKGIDVGAFSADSPNMRTKPFMEGTGVSPIMYPGRDAMMPLIFIDTGSTEWFILSKDSKVRKKVFSAYYDYIDKQKVVVISHEEDRRQWKNSIEVPEWQLGYNFSRYEIVKERCMDLERNFGFVPFEKRQDLKWLDNIKLVVNFHGEHWTGHTFNTFDSMIDELKWLCSHIKGQNILAFLAAWDGRYYYNYPEHSPSSRMGGEEGLKRFVNEAHKLGVKVVLMLGGPNLATFEFLKEHNLEDAAMKNEWAYPILQDWVDWNSDLSKECRGFIVNFGHPGFRQYMVESASDLIRQYDIDGIFLDGAVRWENSPDYSPYEGIVEWAKEMIKRHPDRLLMGEDGYDAIWGAFGLFATSWQPLGLEYSMLRYTRQTYYLAHPAENGSGGVHEQAWFSKGSEKALAEFTIPTISIIDGIIESYGDEIMSKISTYKNWSQKIPDIAK